MTATTQPGITLEEQLEWMRLNINSSALQREPEFTTAILASLIRLREIEGKLREPSNETLGKMMDAWNNEFGSPYTRYVKMLNIAVDDALLLRGKP